MRGLLNQMSRGVVAVAVVVSLAVPVYAKPVNEEGWTPSKIMKVIKRVVKSLGDGLIIPRP